MPLIDPTTDAFCVKLVRARNEAQLSQQQLAELAGMPLVRVTKYEQGICRPSKGNLRKLAGALGLDTEYLLPTVFTGPLVKDALLIKPANIPQRLQRLIQELDAGVQQSFVRRTGLPAGSLSQLLTGKIKMSPGYFKRITDSIPQLNPQWLEKGRPPMMLAAPEFIAQVPMDI